ncbi:MAG: hypothetical protein ABFR36_03845 [Acidobacteriota bacterium]
MKKLFRVTSIINNVTYEKIKYDRVLFTWFIVDRIESEIMYEDVIINYSQLNEKDRNNGEKFINELFSYEEAQMLKSELDLKSSALSTIEEVKLPVPDHIEPFSSLKTEKGKGFSDLSAFKSYQLPFKVRGFFNINDSFESLKGDDQATVITKIPEILKKKDD